MGAETTSLLTILIALPLFGAVLLMFIPPEQKAAHRGVGAMISLAEFVISLPLLSGFDPHVSGFQWTQHFAWIPSIGAGWSLGLDGVSLWIVLLTTFLTPIVLIGSQGAVKQRVREFVASMLVLEAAMLGALVATDLLLFYLFWELMLVPMYLLIGIWGGKNRIYATVKFFIYTLVGSLLMLVAIIYLYVQAGYTFDYGAILALKLSSTEQFWLFTAFSLAFLIKVPIFPFHTWLPDAHTEAPMAGSVILAGVMLKLGTYGLLRFSLPLFPEAMGTYSPLLLILAVVGIVYGAMMAFAQNDVKKLVAYSSVSHLGFVVLGIVALTPQAVEGAILQMVNHGISTGALFLLVGLIYERTHTRAIRDYGGVAVSLPIFTALFVVVTLSSIGLPGTNGFVGEFLILSGTFKEALPIYPGLTGTSWPMLTIILGVLATTGVVLGAVYMLTVVRRVFYGPITHEKNKHLKDMSLREILSVVPLIAAIFFIGLFPNFFLAPIHATVDDLVGTTRPVVEQVRDGERQKIQGGSQVARGEAPAPHPLIRVVDGATPTE